MTLLICERTLSFSSVDEVTIEKVPARSPYKPRFYSSDKQTRRPDTYFGKGLAEHDLMTLGYKVSNSESVSLDVTRCETLVCLFVSGLLHDLMKGFLPCQTKRGVS
jgi:hypothetical protein